MTEPASPGPHEGSGPAEGPVPGPARSAGGSRLRTAGLLVMVAVLGLLTWPRLLGAGGWPVIAQVVSFRAVCGLGLMALAGIVLVLPGARRRRLALVMVLAVAGSAQGGVLLWRGTDPTRAPGTVDLVVLSFNTQHGVAAADLARLVLTQHADVVVLPETTEAVAQQAADLLADAGHPVQVLHHQVDAAPTSSTSVLVSTALGAYEISEIGTSGLGSFVAEPVTAASSTAAEPSRGGPTVVAVHAVPPLGPRSMPSWRADTRWAAEQCRTRAAAGAGTPTGSGVVVAGDFNATLDHPGLRDLGACADAATLAGGAGVGTWPVGVPTWLTTPIDHVLVDSRRWRVEGFAVLPAPAGSDHHPVVAQLANAD